LGRKNLYRIVDICYSLFMIKTKVAALAGAFVVSVILISQGASAPPLPTVTITSAPPVSTSSVAATFAWTTTRKITSTTCKLDAASYMACLSPKTYSGLAVGAHTFTVSVSGPRGSASDSHSWTVTPADITSPTVSLTAPLDGANVFGTISVNANASDNIGVSGVQFKLDGNNLDSEDTSLPYSIAWNTTTVSNASHVLSAVARDAAGNTGNASNISVIVNNVVPPLVACADSFDNDFDGKIDFPADPGCTSLTDTDETDPAPPAYRYMINSGSDQAGVASYGFNLLDVSSKSAADALPVGTQGLIWVGDYDNTSCSWEQSDAIVSSLAASTVGDSKVFGFFFSDEPDPLACSNAPAQHKARNDLIHAANPATRTVLVADMNSDQASLNQIPLWVGKADYVGLDPYPCYQGQPCNYGWIDQVIAAADNADLNYWGVAQAFNDSNWRWPTADELKQMLGQWSASKQSGYMTFAWTWAGNSLSSQPGLLDVLKQFNSGGSPPPPPSGDPVIAVAGDICGSSPSCAPTAALLGQINPDRVLTVGDMAYNDGSLSQFMSYYDPYWGAYKAKTSPSPGNHEFHTANAQGYRDYFGARAPALTYSYNLGAWHIVSLAGGGVSVSTQNAWLQADLAANPSQCLMAYWHEPKFSNGSVHGNSSSYDALWTTLYAAGADVILNGHDHNYQRFAKLNPAGVPDANGIREFIVGTGGWGHYGFTSSTPVPEVRNGDTYGVMKMTLRTGSYDWQFLPVAGQTFTDSGSDSC
jgi:hypothetical protein